MITSVDGKIIFNSGISGNSANLGTINIGNDVNSNLGNVILSSTVSNQNVNLNSGTLQVGNTSNVFDKVNLTMDGGTLNSINNQIDTINVNDLTLGTNNQSTFMFDVDLNTKSDIINVANNFTQNKTLILGPLNIYNNMATTEYKTKFMSDSANAIQAELASAAKYVTVNGVTYNLTVQNNELVITIAGQSGGFNYEVINNKIASRTYNVIQDENVIEWINGNHNLAGSEFYINGDNSHIINGTNTINGVTKTLEGIIVGIDENQLRRVIGNMLNNAINYAFENSVVDISIKLENGFYVFDFKNESEEISESLKVNIFNKYVCGNPLESNSGVGLGLYFCRKILEAHDGTISLDNIGTKNTFSIKIPKLDEKSALITEVAL